jgi:hypothetical protein
MNWVRLGRPVPAAECPVHYISLSTYRGPIHPAAVGAPLVLRSTLDEAFDRVIDTGCDSRHYAGRLNAGTATADSHNNGGRWTFELLRNKSLPQPFVPR